MGKVSFLMISDSVSIFSDSQLSLLFRRVLTSKQLYSNGKQEYTNPKCYRSQLRNSILHTKLQFHEYYQ